MTGGSRIIPIDGGGADGSGVEDARAQAEARDPVAPPFETAREFAGAPDAETDSGPDVEEEAPSLPRAWSPFVAAAFVAGWSAFFAWANLAVLRAGITPAEGAQLVATWSMPVLVAMVALLLVLRTSRRETLRFNDAARLLAAESGRLEARLVSVNTELALARDFIAAQGRDLEALGRIAVDRLSGSADRLQELIAGNGAQVDRIGEVSGFALANMEKLRGQLPVIANSAKDLTNNIGNAGRAAHVQIEDLVSGFQRLNEFGVASERQVGKVRERVDAALEAFAAAAEQIGATAAERFDALDRESAARRAALDASEQAALAALGEQMARLAGETERFEADLGGRRARIEADFAEQRDALERRLAELDRQIGERRSAIAAAGAQAAEALADTLARLDAAVEAQRDKQREEARLLANHCDAVAERVAGFSATLRASGEQGAATAATVDKAMEMLGARLVQMREALSGTDLQIGELTESAVRLLELIRAGGDHTRTQIPEALRSTEAGLNKIEDRVVALRDSLREAGDSGRLLSESIVGTRGDVAAITGEVAALQEAFAARAAEQEAQLEALRRALAGARADSEALSGEVEARLSGAIAELDAAATRTGETLREGVAVEVEALAGRLDEASQAAIVRVLQGRGAELVARLEEAIDVAASSSRETAVQMTDQLARVGELATALEDRIARARARAEEEVNNDFARRAALITESLHSTAIDIAKVFSADVSQSAWASYLRGDRGIFTRRAVSLLDNAEARAVQQHYAQDAEFREHVNRFIHDFEAMLRQLLSTRDGNALGVTLLSSDMGKLYVALAQGIERLRT
ncbi:coiled-coil domain-containing protein [Novosphingobium huizhouense]|uniref:hypothetical protein n=1 Tax=Novosphingobium huizhouense TaxID=2866625 RepID=UPI001CD91786|nr:hypothetical protein [Novosphingobium huizhouense]